MEDTVDITLSETSWRSFAYPVALDFSAVDEAKAFTAKVSSATAPLTQQTRVPAATGIVLHGTTGATLEKVPVTLDSIDSPDNDLVGGTKATTVEANSVYVLSHESSNEVFALYSVTAIDANHAYLKNVASGAKELSIDLGGTVTNINRVNRNTPLSEHTYGLDGRQVGKGYHGIVIRGGKKYLVH